MGEDNILSLSKWKNYEDILDYYSIAYYPRKTHIAQPMSIPQGKSIIRVEACNLDIASSHIRLLINQCKSVKYMVPEAALTYLTNKGIYKTA